MADDFFSRMNQGALGSMGAGGEGKNSSLPILSVILPIFKDSKGGLFAGLDAQGIFGKGNSTGSPFASLWVQKSGDQFMSGLTNVNTGGGPSQSSFGGDSGSNFQNMILAQRSGGSERSV